MKPVVDLPRIDGQVAAIPEPDGMGVRLLASRVTGSQDAVNGGALIA